MQNIVERINAQIAQRVTYGYRAVQAKRGYQIFWSNSTGGYWYRAYYMNRAEGLKLDANIVFVELLKGETKKDIDAVLPLLMKLPLYGNSFEAVYLKV